LALAFERTFATEGAGSGCAADGSDVGATLGVGVGTSTKEAAPEATPASYEIPDFFGQYVRAPPGRSVETREASSVGAIERASARPGNAASIVARLAAAEAGATEERARASTPTSENLASTRRSRHPATASTRALGAFGAASAKLGIGPAQTATDSAARVSPRGHWSSAPSARPTLPPGGCSGLPTRSMP
jgi:hypothetical protein